MALDTQVSRARRYRSTVACEACRKRKVRCSLNVTGVPCAGCTQDNSECIVNAKRARSSKQAETLAPRRRREGPPREIQPILAPQTSQSMVQNPDEGCDAPPESTQSEITRPPATETSSDLEVNDLADEERIGLEIASAALGQSRSVGGVPFYAGDQTGPTSALNLCTSELPLPKHFLIPLHQTYMSGVDEDFLRRKGVFNLPSKSACDSMIEAYLIHVHPILPVIEVDVLVNHHRAGRLQDYKLLLLWSLFFVAINFIPAEVYMQEGFESRRAMKYAMYSRAKCLYDNGSERNKVVLLQSSLLMGFWHSHKDEHAQPWYWSGIAISFCQILGLHRDPGLSHYNPHITDRQRAFWRRLWWCCFFRDRWLGLTLGRPLRIQLNDCDIRMPLAEDLLFDVQNPDGSLITSYLPGDMKRLAESWVMLIEVTCLLGDVLGINRRPAKLKASKGEVESLERQLLASRLPDQQELGLTRIEIFHSNHVGLHYQAMLITFYRHWESEIPSGMTQAAEQDWRQRMQSRADAAASRTNEVLDNLVKENLLGFAGPMTPPLLVPAMQVHLVQCKFGDTLSKRIRLNKLEMCMLILEELQKTYTVASIYRAIFTKAIQQIFPNYSAPSITVSHSASPVPAPVSDNNALGSASQNVNPVVENLNSEQMDEQGFEIPLDLDFMSAFMDENANMDFWQTGNQI